MFPVAWDSAEPVTPRWLRRVPVEPAGCLNPWPWWTHGSPPRIQNKTRPGGLILSQNPGCYHGGRLFQWKFLHHAQQHVWKFFHQSRFHTSRGRGLLGFRNRSRVTGAPGREAGGDRGFFRPVAAERFRCRMRYCDRLHFKAHAGSTYNIRRYSLVPPLSTSRQMRRASKSTHDPRLQEI